MTIIFLFIFVALIAGVALVATGRIGRVPASEHDRPPSEVPTAPLTVESLRATKFNLAFRGYRMEEVDALIRAMEETLNGSSVTQMGEEISNTGGNGGVASRYEE